MSTEIPILVDEAAFAEICDRLSRDGEFHNHLVKKFAQRLSEFASGELNRHLLARFRAGRAARGGGPLDLNDGSDWGGIESHEEIVDFLIYEMFESDLLRRVELARYVGA